MPQSLKKSEMSKAMYEFIHGIRRRGRTLRKPSEEPEPVVVAKPESSSEAMLQEYSEALRRCEVSGDVYTLLMARARHAIEFREIRLKETEDTAKRADLTDLEKLLMCDGALLRELMRDIYDLIFEDVRKHYRDQSRIIYRPEVVAFVIFPAKLSTPGRCSDIVDFWMDHNIELQLLVPGMPSPKHMISEETVRTVLCMCGDGIAEKLFNTFFKKVAEQFRTMFLNKESVRDGYRTTLGWDGQEFAASYRSGESDRKLKGALGTTLFDCTNRTVKGFAVSQSKNHESEDLITILKRIGVDRTAVYVADAINFKAKVIHFLDRCGCDWLLSLKANNKIMYRQVKEFDETFTGEAAFRKTISETASGRDEERTYEAFPAEKVLDAETLKKYPRIRSVVIVYKLSRPIIKRRKADGKKADESEYASSTRYYLTSLECTAKDFAKSAGLIREFRDCEVHHNPLDNAMDQDSLAVCCTNELKAHAGFNKMAYNFFGWARHQMTRDHLDYVKHKPGTKVRPLSYERARKKLSDSLFLTLWYVTRYFILPDLGTKTVPVPPDLIAEIEAEA